MVRGDSLADRATHIGFTGHGHEITRIQEDTMDPARFSFVATGKPTAIDDGS